VNKGIGCASCHGRVDEMPLMYQQNTLQMEWCLNCHRNPAKNLRPTSEIYNMAWAGASKSRPVWCADTGKAPAAGGTLPTAQGITCTTTDPGNANTNIAMLQIGPGSSRGQAGPQSGSGTKLQPVPRFGAGQTVSDVPPGGGLMIPVKYQRFDSQMDLGRYLTDRYHIRPPNELTSCETCHR